MPGGGSPAMRDEAGDDTRRGRHQSGEDQYPRVEDDGIEAVERRGTQRENGFESDPRETQSQHTARGPEQHTLDRQLARQAKAAAAERGPNGRLTTPLVGSGQKQIGDVHAGDQQQHHDGGHQDPHRVPHPVGHAGDQGLPRPRGLDRLAHVDRRLEPFERALEGDAFAKNSDRGTRAGALDERTPQLHVARAERKKRRARGHHAHDGPRLAIEIDRRAQDGRIAPEARRPQPVPQHHDPPILCGLLIGEGATKDGVPIEDRMERRPDEADLDCERVARAQECHAPHRRHLDMFEDVVHRGPGIDLLHRRRAHRARVSDRPHERDHAVRIGVGHGSEHDPFQGGEHRRGRSDSEGDGQHREEGERRPPREAPRGRPSVVGDTPHPPRPPRPPRPRAPGAHSPSSLRRERGRSAQSPARRREIANLSQPEART